jgi:PilZ domain
MSGDNGYRREKRLTTRHKINIAVKYRVWKSYLPECAGESLDISEGGMCFVSRTLLEEGDTLQLRFDMPEEVVDEPTAEWRCTGQILKVERFGALPRCQVRVRFDCYEIERPNGTTTIHLDLSSLRFGSPSAGKV